MSSPKNFRRAALLGILALTVAAVWYWAGRKPATPVVAEPAAPAAAAPAPVVVAPTTPAAPVSTVPALAGKTPPPAPVPATATVTPVAVSSPNPIVSAPVATAPATAAPNDSQSAEVAATRRMYMAHAPLRTPEVADPDSEANRRILQTMVEKALARTAIPAASATASPSASVPTP